MTGRVLVVDDEEEMCRLVALDLESRGHTVAWETDPQQALARPDLARFDLLLTDLRMPGLDGLALCRQALKRAPSLRVVVLTAFGSMQTAVEALRAGAYDFVTKPVELELLARCVERAVDHRELERRVERLGAEVARGQGFGELIGECAVMRQLYALLERVAPTDASVLITGESGTGKELVARALHARSPRAQAPFVAINCAALPEDLLESELFGHRRGAFTGALSARQGLFRAATGGSIFLDEVGEVPASLQAKLLRALEERVVRPVGSDVDEPVDVRIIAATNQDLHVAVREKRFRPDLFFRLNVIAAEVAPLRERGSDALLLANHFLKALAERHGVAVEGLDHQAAARLLDYDWPGNVRELRNAMEHAVVLARGPRIGLNDLPADVRGFAPPPAAISAAPSSEPLMSLADVERRHILRVLEATGQRRARAAEILGLDRKTLYRKLKQYAEAKARAGGGSA